MDFYHYMMVVHCQRTFQYNQLEKVCTIMTPLSLSDIADTRAKCSACVWF